jgi:hypothetical protein
LSRQPARPEERRQTTPWRRTRVYWYSTYVFHGDWWVPIDDDGYVMQV